MPRRSKPPPAAFLAQGASWPYGPFDADAPPYVAAIAQMAARLIAIADERNLGQRGIARETGVNLATVNSIYSGSAIPDTATLAALEHSLSSRLWADE